MIIISVNANEDKDLFVLIYEKHSDVLLRYANYLLASDDAEDIVQDAFIRIHKNIHKLRNRTDNEIKNFLIVTTRNLCLTYLNKKGRGHDWDSLEEFDNIRIPNDISVADIIETKDSIKAIYGQLNHLDQQLLILSTMYDMTYKEIASHTGLSEKNVSVRLYRLRKKIKTQYIGIENGESSTK